MKARGFRQPARARAVRRAAGAAVLALTLLTGGTLQPAVGADDLDPYFARPGVLLATPGASPLDNTTLVHLLDNINHAPPGSTIRLVVFSLDLGAVTDALLAAADRGVHVQAVIDDHSRKYLAAWLLRQALGNDITEPSYVVFARGAARGAGEDGELHQKTWMFSQTGQSRNVVMVGSMNLTTYGTTQQYSDTYTFLGRSDVWAAFNRVFEQQRLDQPAPRRPLTMRLRHGVTTYFNPGFSRDRDPVQKVLRGIDPRGAEVRVAAFAWYGPRGENLARTVIGLRDAGTDVRVIVGHHVSGPIRGMLRRAGIAFHRGAFRGGENIHFKLVLVREAGRRPFALTGSDNWSDTSFAKDDLDIVIPLTRAQYDAYLGVYGQVVRRSKREYGG